MPHLVRIWGGAILAASVAISAPMLCAAPAFAEAYTVAGVKVRATGLKPELARAKAVADGELAAFNRLVRRMTLPEDHARLPKPDAEAVRAIVRNFSIEKETGEGERYSATVAYRFDKDAVRAMLQGAGIPFIDSPSPPIVVLPVWIVDGKAHLWDDPNPWREAWMRLEPEDTLADFARLRGDLADLKAISAAEAVPGNKAALNKIADQYKAGLVAIAASTVDKGKRRITVHLVDLANGRASAIGVFAVGEDAAALDKAAAQIARAIDTSWKRNAVAVEQNAVTVRIRAPIQGLDHWIRIRQALRGMPQVRNLTTVSMSPGEALVELRFAGTLAEFRRQIEQQGFTLKPEGAPAPAGTPPAGQSPGGQLTAGEVWILTAPSVPPVKQTDLPPPGTPGEKPAEKTPERAPAPNSQPAKKP